MLRWLKTVVVSDEEKAHVMRQAGTRKTTTAEASKLLDDIRTGAMVCVPG
jgi:protein required for attachment to host cells